MKLKKIKKDKWFYQLADITKNSGSGYYRHGELKRHLVKQYGYMMNKKEEGIELMYFYS